MDLLSASSLRARPDLGSRKRGALRISSRQPAGDVDREIFEALLALLRQDLRDVCDVRYVPAAFEIYSLRLTGRLENGVRRFFADHVNRAHDEKPGILGNTDAWTTRRFAVFRTKKRVSRTAFGSSSAPIGHVHEA
jgi:hypothetical protein